MSLNGNKPGSGGEIWVALEISLKGNKPDISKIRVVLKMSLNGNKPGSGGEIWVRCPLEMSLKGNKPGVSKIRVRFTNANCTAWQKLNLVCDPSERLVRLKSGETHNVSICHPVTLYPNGQKKTDITGPMKISRFRCDGLICNRCRCDVERGFMLSNDSATAVCTRFCPVTKIISPQCFHHKYGVIC
ncbi:unnamed protein product [Dracunculus medinensis]|uniref:CTCK domain-containing protein n=1 Tax=Dracunculus medinensis TaxID=318479 RepID=A0A0N4UDI8_DRAME|nr:unnamed protein product [Dracunculus medinensis]